LRQPGIIANVCSKTSAGVGWGDAEPHPSVVPEEVSWLTS
jgi:hypothetical protein